MVGAVPFGLTRNVLPAKELRLWGAGPVMASPVPTCRVPSGAKRSRHPPCWPVLMGMPVSTGAPLRVADVPSAARTQRSTLMSTAAVPVPLKAWHV